MKSNKRSLIDLVDKCKLSEPISDSHRKKIIQDQNKNYKALLRKTGVYTPIIGILTTIIFFGKKIGLTLSYFNSFVIFSVTGLAITAVVSTGTYLVVKDIIKDMNQPEIEEKVEDIKRVVKPEEILKDRKIKVKKAKKLKKPPVRSALPPISLEISTTSGEAGNIARESARVLTNKLISAKGRSRILKPARIKGNEGFRTIIGCSLNNRDYTFTLNVKVIRRANKRVVFSTSKTISDITEIEFICTTIAEGINRKIW